MLGLNESAMQCIVIEWKSDRCSSKTKSAQNYSERHYLFNSLRKWGIYRSPL